jgi:hypothetical protein
MRPISCLDFSLKLPARHQRLIGGSKWPLSAPIQGFQLVCYNAVLEDTREEFYA